MTIQRSSSARALPDPRAILDLVTEVLEKHRIDIGDRPETKPVQWNGMSMSFEAADEVVTKLEAEKLAAQKTMNKTQLAGEMTKIIGGAAGGAATITGLALLVFPPTMPAGLATLASGVGAAILTRGVGDGVSKIGTNHAEQTLHQLDAYIASIREAQVEAGRRLARGE
jgi:hypothetical protein